MDIFQFLVNFFNRRKPNLAEVDQLRRELLEDSRLDTAYIVASLGACIIATLGLLTNSVAVIIGAMVVAPLMLPIRGLAFAALEGDVLLFRQSLFSLGVGTLLSVFLSAGMGATSGISSYGEEIFARSKPTLLDLGIAIAAGGVGGYAKIQPKVSGSFAGVAIAVALMPPICVIGLGLAQTNQQLSLGALLLYLTNLLGITLACMLTFFLKGYTPLAQASRALTIAVVLTSLLITPLGISFINLVNQSRLETNLKQALLSRTFTLQRLELIKLNINWFTEPPQVRLNVRGKETVTPRQVQLLEEFLERSMGRPFTLIFEVSRVEEVRRDGTSSPSQNP